MAIDKWKNNRTLNRHDPDVEDMFAIDYPQGDNTELMETEHKRNRNKINQAR